MGNDDYINLYIMNTINFWVFNSDTHSLAIVVVISCKLMVWYVLLEDKITILNSNIICTVNNNFLTAI